MFRQMEKICASVEGLRADLEKIMREMGPRSG